MLTTDWPQPRRHAALPAAVPRAAAGLGRVRLRYGDRSAVSPATVRTLTLSRDTCRDLHDISWIIQDFHNHCGDCCAVFLHHLQLRDDRQEIQSVPQQGSAELRLGPDQGGGEVLLGRDFLLHQALPARLHQLHGLHGGGEEQEGV